MWTLENRPKYTGDRLEIPSDLTPSGDQLAMSTQTWTVAEAKAKFSEVVERACVSGPQTITENGRTAVVVSAEEWERKTRRPGNLATFFAESPLRGSRLKSPCKKQRPRAIDL